MPIKIPVITEDIINTGRYTYILKSAIIMPAISNWPILCAMAPATLIPIMLKYLQILLYINHIIVKLSSPPEILNRNPEILLPKSEPNKHLRVTMSITSLKLKNMIAIRVTKLASPNLIPGTAKGMGSIPSTT